MKEGVNIPKYTAEQLRWCRMYEAETGWAPLMCDFENGNESFYEAARRSVGWFESWASNALLRVTAHSIPGAPQIETGASSRK